MNRLKSSRTILSASLALVTFAFIIANVRRYLSAEAPLGPYYAIHSFVPWLMQWGAIALLLECLSQKVPPRREWLSPQIVLPWFGVGVVWWIAMLSVLWNIPLLEFLNERVHSYASETFDGSMSLLDWLLYFGWFISPYQSSAPFSLMGWGGVTALVHTVSVTVVFCGLGYRLSRRSHLESAPHAQSRQGRS